MSFKSYTKRGDAKCRANDFDDNVLNGQDGLERCHRYYRYSGDIHHDDCHFTRFINELCQCDDNCS